MSTPQLLRTSLTDLVGVSHPVVQTGMGWVAGPRLVAATANAGALGILASATMTLDELEKAILEVQERTDQPFGVNLRADAGDAGDRVRLVSESGSYEGRARLDDVKPGNLQVHWPEGNVLLSREGMDAASHEPDYNAIVRLEKA